MASVVFLRGVNVGGNRVFRPSELAKKLAALDIVNIGAAGTFVVRKRVSQAELRKQIERELPFEAKIVICSGSEVTKLVAADPFEGRRVPKGATQYVSVLASPKGSDGLTALPVTEPAGRDWQVRIFDVHGRFVLSEHRRGSGRQVNLNEIIERPCGPATTRNWNTINRIADVLAKE